jgi:hypothetical protein
MYEHLPFKQIVALDFEFQAPPGERPRPLCGVWRELRSGELRRIWLEGQLPPPPPYDTGPDVLYVGFFSSAEWGCYLELGLPLPVRILDLYVEFRVETNGYSLPYGRGLLGALLYYQLDALGAEEKTSMRDLAQRGGPYSDKERTNLLDYNQTDVDAVARLFPKMLPKIDLPRALLRGRFMPAVARMEQTAVPIDVPTLKHLKENWIRIKGQLIASLGADYDLFVPAGEPRLDSESAFGSVVLQEARDWSIDAYQLAAAVRQFWEEERESTRDLHAARHAARKDTGLTKNRIRAWESAGWDYSNYPGLDAAARDLAARYPALGIGQGYSADSGVDDADYGGRLWALLRDDDETIRPRHDPGRIREAAEMVASAGPADFREMRFSEEKFAAYLIRKDIPWPRLKSGRLDLDDETFRQMAKVFPAEIGPIRELRHTLSQLKLNNLSVGQDERNRTLLSPFGARTGRNTPSSAKFIFGPSVWLRALIKPPPGRAVAYVDWSQQELAIAAYLSGDRRMQECYAAGDFYLTFGKMAGAIPMDGTKEAYAKEREQLKQTCLGILYGLYAFGLSRRLDILLCRGRQLLQMHREVFRTFWEWSDAVEVEGMFACRLQTCFGWPLHVVAGANPRSIRNFLVQSHGSEMLRIACCLLTERGIPLDGPVHDAVLSESSENEIDDVVAQTQGHMRKASELVLPNFPLRTEAKIVRYPDRYIDPRGRGMWEVVLGLLESVDRPGTPLPPVGPSALPPVGGDPSHRWDPRPI